MARERSNPCQFCTIDSNELLGLTRLPDEVPLEVRKGELAFVGPAQKVLQRTEPLTRIRVCVEHPIDVGCRGAIVAVVVSGRANIASGGPTHTL